MQSRLESERHTNLIITDRPDSSQLVDLHVYVVPKKIWKNRQNLAENVAIDQAISAGFVRIPESLTIHDLRRYIIDICGDDNDFPKEFLYLRSVGRCLTKVKQQQEKELKVKNYRPPMTFASEIYILEQDHDDNSSRLAAKKGDLFQESSRNSHNWIKPIEGSSSSSYPLFNHHSISIPTFSAKISPRVLLKLRQEQERLYLRQTDLAQKRHEIENQQKEEQAAIRIQTAFRNYRDRQNIKQQEIDDIVIERLRLEARQLIRRSAEAEYAGKRQAHDVVRLSNRLEELRAKRIELETNRELIIRRMKQLHTQINNRRREEKDLWKKKYLIEKNQITASQDQNYTITKNPTDIHNQFEQAKIRLNNATKLRQQAEYQSGLLRHELQQISSTLNTLERYRLPKQQQQQIKPFTLDITLKY